MPRCSPGCSLLARELLWDDALKPFFFIHRFVFMLDHWENPTFGWCWKASLLAWHKAIISETGRFLFSAFPDNTFTFTVNAETFVSACCHPSANSVLVATGSLSLIPSRRLSFHLLVFLRCPEAFCHISWTVLLKRCWWLDKYLNYHSGLWGPYDVK